MKTILFIFLLIILSKNNLHSQPPDVTIYFDNGQAILNGESKAQLKDLIEKIKKDKSPQIMISGFTDLNGNAESNLALSKKRALFVSDYFIANGIEKNRITVQFFGEDRPIAKNEKDLRENRRVEITIGTLKKKDEKNSLGIYGKLWKAPVKHVFSETKLTSNDVLVMDGAGTKIWIQGNFLCRPNGEPVRGDVEIELTEYYKRSEMLLANLLTVSDSAMLQTEGMVNVVARSGGERLSLKKGSAMGIRFMISKEEQNLGIFIGSQPGNQMNWEQQSDNGLAAIKMPTSYVSSSWMGTERPSKDNLVLSSDRLGWISCSRLSKMEIKTNLSVEVDPIYHATVRLVFKDLHAIMPGYKNVNGAFKVMNIPVGQKATIVVFGMVKETPYFISKDIVIRDNQVEKLVPKITTFEAVRTILKKVN